MDKLLLDSVAIMLVVTLALCDPSAVVAQNTEASPIDTTAAGDLPKVEKDFSVIQPVRGLGDDGETFAAMIPAKSIQRIILLYDHGFDLNARGRIDPDGLFAQLVESPVRSGPWGIDALEKSVAECIIITKKAEVFKVTVLSQVGREKPAVTGVLLYGKGFSYRFDFRESPLTTPARG